MSGKEKRFPGFFECPADAPAEPGASLEPGQSRDIIQDGSKVCIVSTGDWFSFGTAASGR